MTVSPRYSSLRLFVRLDLNSSRWRQCGRTVFVPEPCLQETKVVTR